jgi:hypothetical protein
LIGARGNFSFLKEALCTTPIIKLNTYTVFFVNLNIHLKKAIKAEKEWATQVLRGRFFSH